MSRGYGKAQRWLIARLEQENHPDPRQRWVALVALAEEYRKETAGASQHAAEEGLRRALKRLEADGKAQVGYWTIQRTKVQKRRYLRPYQEKWCLHIRVALSPMERLEEARLNLQDCEALCAEELPPNRWRANIETVRAQRRDAAQQRYQELLALVAD